MNKRLEQKIEVYAHWQGLSQPKLAGILYIDYLRGKEIFSFAYHRDWLKNSEARAFDPALKLLDGRQYVVGEQNNFGIFLDSSPDRWGRFLMERREALFAREENRKPHKLLESDFLLGVYDQHRMGAIRFKTQSQGPFLNDNKNHAAPPFIFLRHLEQACLSLEKGEHNNMNDAKWLKMLIAPGSSLGGARPKASVIDEKKHLWIAKFPSINDQHDIGAWELVANKLASQVGITIASSGIKKLNNRYHTFLSKRFDRTDLGERIHFASAMTLLQRIDGDNATKGGSYLELAEFIIQHGGKPERDLEQLWRRIIFYICISNVDDHLRNHGFLLDPSYGWVLSPAFDMNPNPYGDGLTLNISESENTQDLELAKEVALYFRVKAKSAEKIIREIVKGASNWRREAKALGISASEQDRLARAFRVVENYSL